MPDTIKRPSEPAVLNWGIVVGAWLAFMFVTGGVSTPTPLASTLHLCASVPLLILSSWRLRNGFPNRFSVFGWALLVACFLLVCAQMVPLPPSIWQNFQARELIASTLALTGSDLPWLPLTLAPPETAKTLIAMVPVFAGFLAALSLNNRDMAWLSAIVVICAVLAGLLGLLQKAGRAPEWLYFYGTPGALTATGAFGNRNFFAAQIFSSIPFLAVLATAIQRSRGVSPVIVLMFVLIYMAIMLSGLATAGSRGGILLAMPSVFLTLLFIYRFPIEASRARKSGFAIFAVIGGVLVISQASMIGILRLVEKDPLADFRSTIFATTWTAIKAVWPAGSGFGSFVPVYQMHEIPDAIVDRYVNAAHNDWLQLLLEGGIAAVVLGAAFVGLYLISMWRILKNNVAADEYSATVRAASVVVFLLAAHAVVDFGLRTPALLALFSLCCGLTCLSGRYSFNAAQLKGSQIKAVEKMEPRPRNSEPRTKPYFKQKPPV